MICKLPSSSLRRDCVRGSIYEHPRDLGLYGRSSAAPLVDFSQPHYTVGTTEAHRGEGTCPKPHNGSETELGFKLKGRPHSQHPSLRNKGSHENQGRKKAGIFQRPRTGLPSFAQASVY